MNSRAGGPQTRPGDFGEEKSLPEMEPQFGGRPTPSVVTTLTELFCLIEKAQ